MTESTPDGAVLALLWQQERPRTRGPRPAHSLAQLLDTAIATADAEGLDAVSMQRLSDDLGFTKMAVYRYVPSRSVLLALMTDRALGVAPDCDGEDWRDQLRAWTLGLNQRFMQHTWGLVTTLGPRPVGRNEAGWMEAGLRILGPFELDATNRLDTLALLSGHARAMAEQRSGGASEAGLVSSLHIALQNTHGEDFPFLRETFSALSTSGLDQAFDFGLDCILDGLAKRLSRTEAK